MFLITMQLVTNIKGE